MKNLRIGSILFGLAFGQVSGTYHAPAATLAVSEIGLTVGSLDRELDFYTNALPFRLIALTQANGPTEDQRLDLENVHLRVAELQLGGERIRLTEPAVKGRPIPSDSRSNDHWFQHIAIVVRDMDSAFRRLQTQKARFVSTAPQTLPSWNTNAGGIKAFYFRDPEDHVLEIIWFPPGKGNPKWQKPTKDLFLGIDHTAIVVSDTERSLAFYRNLLGLCVAGESENYGVEQEHLNQVFGARLRITGLRADRGPGVEFLEYLTPPGGRDLPTDSAPGDLTFWTTHLGTEDSSALKEKLRRAGVRFVSTSESETARIVRDPDGHAVELDSINSGEHTAAR